MQGRNHTCRGLRIVKEIEKENSNKEEDGFIATSVQNASKNLDTLGIMENLQGLEHPVCGSLAKLRAATGLASNQKKINDLLNVGKGKFLPAEP